MSADQKESRKKLITASSMTIFIVILFCFLPSTFFAFEPIRSRNTERQDKQPNQRRARQASQSRESNRYRERDYNDDDLHQEQENIIPFSMEHTFGNNVWSKRGDIEFMFNSVTKRVGKVKFVEVEIIPDHIENLQRITLEDGFYRVRLVPRDYDKNNDQKYVVASVKGCALMASDFREMFTFHSDIYGTIISLDYKTTTDNCPSPPKTVTEKYFRSKGKITVAIPGKSPYITKDSIFSKDAQGSKPAEKSFFQKYWVYILAAGVTWFVIAAAGAEAGGGGGGEGGGGS